MDVPEYLLVNRAQKGVTKHAKTDEVEKSVQSA